jgi:hypothetical protein
VSKRVVEPELLRLVTISLKRFNILILIIIIIVIVIIVILNVNACD